MIWVHGGVHGNWGANMFPFVKEAVERGYVVICPEYRGSTGYGEAHHNAIDYGGYEVDDTMSAVEYLKTLPHVDQDRLGHHGMEPRRLHHAALGLPRHASVQGRGRHGAGDEPRVPAVLQGTGLPAAVLDAVQDPGSAVREARSLHRALAALSRRQAAGPAARSRRDQRYRRRLRRGSADSRRAAVAEAGPCRDEGLRGSRCPDRPAAATRSTGA